MSDTYTYGDRILLRAMEPTDLDLLYGIENSPELWQVSNTSAPYSRYFLKQYIARTQSDIYAERQLRLVIVERETEKPVGMIDLMNFEPLHNRAEVGIALLLSHRGKGIAREALTLLADYCFRFLRLHQLYAFIPCDNADSLRLFSGCGFRESARLRQWVRRADDYVDAVVVQLFAKCE